MIQARGLCKSFSGVRVLDGVDVTVNSGEILGLVGPGGGGKSLLLKLIAGLVEPDDGVITVDEVDISKLDRTGWSRMRERFGMLFQNYALFDFMTVGENVAFPLEQRRELPKSEIHERVSQRLAEVDLPGIHHLFPRELSGGMKKRVALARATIAEAPKVIYDDPTAGLDPVTSSKIFKLIERLHNPEGISIIASHDVDRMIEVCHRWLLIYEGRVHFRGDTEAAMASTDPIVRTFFDGTRVEVSA